jgi:hypothetical protein
MSPQSRHLVKRLFMLQLIQSFISPRHFPLLYLCTLAFDFFLWADLKPEPIWNTINAGDYHHNSQGKIYLYSTLLLLWIPLIVFFCFSFQKRCNGFYFIFIFYEGEPNLKLYPPVSADSSLPRLSLHFRVRSFECERVHEDDLQPVSHLNISNWTYWIIICKWIMEML